MVTETTKICAGRPRPDLIDRCQPLAGSANGSPYGLATAAICTRTDLLREGFRSFPSGHSSSAFAGLGFLSFYLAGKLHLFEKRGCVRSQCFHLLNYLYKMMLQISRATIAAWLALTPLLGATLIGISRTMDYRHHATDVLVCIFSCTIINNRSTPASLIPCTIKQAGSLIGLVLGYFGYRLYYPPLYSSDCHARKFFL